MENQNITVALLLGGASPEREVSKSSCKSVLFALRKLGYKVKVFDPAYGLNQPSDERSFFEEKDYSDVSPTNYIELINSTKFDDVDLVFNGLHGKWGEDGTVQALLDLRGIKHTGTGLLGSAVAMNKSFTKIMFQHFDVQTPKWFVVDSKEKNYELIQNKIKKFFGYPCIIKPNDQGSTVGLTLCRGDSEIKEAVILALKYSEHALIEEYIDGYELTVAVFNNHCFPPLQIKPKKGLYDYESKYTQGMSEYEVPANFPDEVLNHLKHQALLAFTAVGAKTYARVDFRLNRKHESYCLEVNTLPGMTGTSLVPKMAKAVGIEFEELIDRIVKLSLE